MQTIETKDSEAMPLYRTQQMLNKNLAWVQKMKLPQSCKVGLGDRGPSFFVQTCLLHCNTFYCLILANFFGQLFIFFYAFC